MVNEPTTDQMNEAIARFMGYKVYNKRYPRNHGIGAPEMKPEKCIIIQKAKYHTSWDWLMPVVEKIESIKNSVRIYTGHTTICTNTGHPVCQIVETSKIKATHAAVYQFITWLNQQKQNDGKR